MKKICSITGLLLVCISVFAQVGIGTQTPNTRSILELSSTSKGLLLPRMTSGDRTSMPLSSTDAGMMVYQTSIPKGLYAWDGANWNYSSPVEAGSATSTTLRWDNANSKWISASNLYNGGGSIGINTGNAPNYQLHINSIGSNTRLQLTASTFGVLQGDGLLVGINNTLQPVGSAYLLQQENRPLWFGTNAQERMRIDSIGRIGINTSSPTATLDVNGSMKLGANGSVIQSIMRVDILVDPPVIAVDDEWIANVPCPNSTMDAVVYTSPGATIDQIVIAYSRVSAPGMVEVKMVNMSPQDNNPPPVMLHIAVIQ